MKNRNLFSEKRLLKFAGETPGGAIEGQKLEAMRQQLQNETLVIEKFLADEPAKRAEDEKTLNEGNLLERTFGSTEQVLQRSRDQRMTFIMGKITGLKEKYKNVPEVQTYVTQLMSNFQNVQAGRRIEKITWGQAALNSGKDIMEVDWTDFGVAYAKGIGEGTWKAMKMLVDYKTYVALVGLIGTGFKEGGKYLLSKEKKSPAEVMKTASDWGLKMGQLIGEKMDKSSPEQLANIVGDALGQVIGADVGMMTIAKSVKMIKAVKIVAKADRLTKAGKVEEAAVALSKLERTGGQVSKTGKMKRLRSKIESSTKKSDAIEGAEFRAFLKDQPASVANEKRIGTLKRKIQKQESTLAELEKTGGKTPGKLERALAPLEKAAVQRMATTLNRVVDGILPFKGKLLNLVSNDKKLGEILGSISEARRLMNAEQKVAKVTVAGEKVGSLGAESEAKLSGLRSNMPGLLDELNKILESRSVVMLAKTNAAKLFNAIKGFLSDLAAKGQKWAGAMLAKMSNTAKIAKDGAVQMGERVAGAGKNLTGKTLKKGSQAKDKIAISAAVAAERIGARVGSLSKRLLPYKGRLSNLLSNNAELTRVLDDIAEARQLIKLDNKISKIKVAGQTVGKLSAESAARLQELRPKLGELYGELAKIMESRTIAAVVRTNAIKLLEAVKGLLRDLAAKGQRWAGDLLGKFNKIKTGISETAGAAVNKVKNVTREALGKVGEKLGVRVLKARRLLAQGKSGVLDILTVEERAELGAQYARQLEKARKALSQSKSPEKIKKWLGKVSEVEKELEAAAKTKVGDTIKAPFSKLWETTRELTTAGRQRLNNLTGKVAEAGKAVKNKVTAKAASAVETARGLKESLGKLAQRLDPLKSRARLSSALKSNDEINAVLRDMKATKDLAKAQRKLTKAGGELNPDVAQTLAKLEESMPAMQQTLKDILATESATGIVATNAGKLMNGMKQMLGEFAAGGQKWAKNLLGKMGNAGKEVAEAGRKVGRKVSSAAEKVGEAGALGAKKIGESLDKIVNRLTPLRGRINNLVGSDAKMSELLGEIAEFNRLAKAESKLGKLKGALSEAGIQRLQELKTALPKIYEEINVMLKQKGLSVSVLENSKKLVQSMNGLLTRLKMGGQMWAAELIGNGDKLLARIKALPRVAVLTREGSEAVTVGKQMFQLTDAQKNHMRDLIRDFSMTMQNKDLFAANATYKRESGAWKAINQKFYEILNPGQSLPGNSPTVMAKVEEAQKLAGLPEDAVDGKIGPVTMNALAKKYGFEDFEARFA